MQSKLQLWRDWIANHMGIDESRKEAVYLEVSQASSLLDVSYWVQVVFAAGIATLGLVLNSPAVIIGAMLISPLMGPILSMGLALAAGDFILVIRSVANLALSCYVAILLSSTLVFLLPFKEITAEIAGRTQPNILDLGIALFSGAVGSIATCKPIKGVVNSIPGAAIAVALMPPLCVVGFGLGIALSHNLIEGVRISTGGGLLFLTNLVAITFTAMLVFLGLHIDTDRVKESIKQWNLADPESCTVQKFLAQNTFLQKLRPVGSLPGRIFMVLGLIFLLMIPLSASFDRLRKEIFVKNEESKVRRIVREVWGKNLASDSFGNPRSYLDQMSVQTSGNTLTINLSAFTSKPLSPTEREEYVRQVALLLNKTTDEIRLNLIEVPTASSEITDRKETIAEQPPEIASLEDSQFNFLQAIDTRIGSIPLPPQRFLVTYRVILGKDSALHLKLVYLGDDKISKDAEFIISEEVQRRMGLPEVTVSLEYVDSSSIPLAVTGKEKELSAKVTTVLDRVGDLLSRYPSLKVEITGSESSSRQLVFQYLQNIWEVPSSQITMIKDGGTSVQVKLMVAT